MFSKYIAVLFLHTQVIALCPSRTPICATDGNTYPTICHMKRAKAKDPDLQLLHDGPCYLSQKNLEKIERAEKLKHEKQQTNETSSSNIPEQDARILLNINPQNLRIRIQGCDGCWRQCSREFNNDRIKLSGGCVQCCYNRLMQKVKAKTTARINPFLLQKPRQRSRPNHGERIIVFNKLLYNIN